MVKSLFKVVLLETVKLFSKAELVVSIRLQIIFP